MIFERISIKVTSLILHIFKNYDLIYGIYLGGWKERHKSSLFDPEPKFLSGSGQKSFGSLRLRLRNTAKGGGGEGVHFKLS